MIQTKEKSINGHDYQVTQFPAMTGIRLAVRIVKTLGGGVAKLGSIKGGLSGLMDMDTSEINIGGIVEGLLENLDDEKSPKLILDLFQTTHRDRVLLDDRGFNDAFAANYVEMAMAIAFIIEVNYGDFFGMLETGQTAIGNPVSSAEKAK